MSGIGVLIEGWMDRQADLPFVDFNGVVVVAIVAGYHHNCALLVRGVQCVRGLL